MLVHLVDGTYELFRHFYAVPPEKNADGLEVAAIQGVLASMLYLLGDGATHLAVATDHVIESFRNDLWPGYKTGAGIDAALLAQFQPLEQALSAMGVVVLPMVEFEADDALAAAAAVAAADPRVARVLICTPDKDLAQCVFGERIVQFDRRARVMRDEAGVDREVRRAAGVDPRLSRAGRRQRRRLPRPARLGRQVGGGGARALRAPSIGSPIARRSGTSPCAARRRWRRRWPRSASRRCCSARWRRCAWTRRPSPSIDELRWRGPAPEFEAIAAWLGQPSLFARAQALAARLPPAVVLGACSERRSERL